MSILQRGLAVPCFAEDPMELAELGVEAERAGFDGFFLWDHIVFSNTGEGPPIVDPWLVLAVVAARTTRIRLGTMITPVPGGRPWQLAKETTTLDRLSNGRLILGVGIGSPAYGDFGIFHEPADERVRAELLDEGLDILAGLWSGERFSYQGRHFTLDPVRFTPTPVQRPRIPVWVGGVLPGGAADSQGRALGWHGADPVRRTRPGPAIGRGHGRCRREDRRCARRGPGHRGRPTGRVRPGGVGGGSARCPPRSLRSRGPTRTAASPGGSRRPSRSPGGGKACKNESLAAYDGAAGH